MEHSKGTLAAIALVVGLAIGGGTGYAISASMEKTDDAPTSSETKTSNKDGVTVGGALMVRDLDIVDNAANADNVSTVVSLVQKADLVETLKSDGPFTVFGPTNDAFGKLPAETVASLQEEKNKAALANILTYHVAAGTYTSADLRVMAKAGDTIKTVQGEILTPVLKDNKLYIEDAKGGMALVETADVISSNGVTHVIDSVLMPKK